MEDKKRKKEDKRKRETSQKVFVMLCYVWINYFGLLNYSKLMLPVMVIYAAGVH